MRAHSRRVFEISLSGGSLRSVRREVKLVIVDEWGVHVRLMTMGRMSIYVRGEWLWRTLERGVYFSMIRCAVWVCYILSQEVSRLRWVLLGISAQVCRNIS
jgi:threonine/homoserine efflux transporter RhtA